MSTLKLWACVLLDENLNCRSVHVRNTEEAATAYGEKMTDDSAEDQSYTYEVVPAYWRDAPIKTIPIQERRHG